MSYTTRKRQFQRSRSNNLLQYLNLVPFLLIDESSHSTSVRQSVRRELSFWEEQVPSWSDAEFKRNFRMNRSTFDLIATGLHPFLAKQTCKGAPLSPRKVCAIGVWRLKEAQMSYQAIAVLFQVGRSTAYYSTILFVRTINHVLFDKYVHLPRNQEEFESTSRKFEVYSHGVFKHAVGAIDGTHLPIHKPDISSDPNHKYVNRKGWPSLNCLAIVDRNSMFLYFNARWPGSVGDSRILTNSRLSSGRFLPPQCFLLGDAGFPLESWLLTPYRETPGMTPAQRNFNKFFSSSRIIVEQSFGELKARWRILLHEIYASPTEAAGMASACVILHNICRYHDDRFLDSWAICEEEIRGHEFQEEEHFIPDRDENLQQWRNSLCEKVDDYYHG